MLNHGIVVADRDSSFIRLLVVNPAEQTACDTFKDNNHVYEYSNVPSEECLKVASQPDLSLGKWFHQVLSQPGIYFTKTAFGFSSCTTPFTYSEFPMSMEVAALVVKPSMPRTTRVLEELLIPAVLDMSKSSVLKRFNNAKHQTSSINADESMPKRTR